MSNKFFAKFLLVSAISAAETDFAAGAVVRNITGPGACIVYKKTPLSKGQVLPVGAEVSCSGLATVSLYLLSKKTDSKVTSIGPLVVPGESPVSLFQRLKVMLGFSHAESFAQTMAKALNKSQGAEYEINIFRC